jgi:uncharacterized protein involved in type VI secretion and phage assembly
VLVAVVTSTDDPEQVGRIRVRLESVSGHPEMWAPTLRVRSDAGQNRFIEGDRVLVAFELGDLDRPYVLGAL